jgi:hypothetical protein
MYIQTSELEYVIKLTSCIHVQEAEEENFKAEDLEIALTHCGEKSPIRWLKENWPGMVRTVQTLTSDYQTEMDGLQNSIGRPTVQEAEHALRLHKGNVWASVVECTKQRKDKVGTEQQKSRSLFLYFYFYYYFFILLLPNFDS